MPFSRPIRSVTNCPSTTSDGRCGSDWTSAGRVRWPTAQTKLAAFPTQHRRGGALMLGMRGQYKGHLGGLDKVFKIRDRHHRIHRQKLRQNVGLILILAQS